MLEKIKGIVGSIRFWVVTFGWLAAYLGVVAQKGFDLGDLFTQIGIWLGSVAALGTLDAVAERISGNQQ